MNECLFGSKKIPSYIYIYSHIYTTDISCRRFVLKRCPVVICNGGNRIVIVFHSNYSLTAYCTAYGPQRNTAPEYARHHLMADGDSSLSL